MEAVTIENARNDMDEFHEDWISDLIAERDEARESKEICMKQLEECKLRIKQLEDDQDTEEIQSDTSSVSEIDDKPMYLHSTQNGGDEIKSKNIDGISDKNSNHGGNAMEKVEDLQGDTNTSKQIKIGNNSAYAITTNHDSGIELDIDVFTREIKDQVEILVNEKLNDFGRKQKTKKYSTVLTKNTKEGLLRTNSNQEHIRDLNIIIHGINESETPDDFFIKELFDIMEVNTGPVMAHRLGEKKADRPRPIKIVMDTKEHKAEFMSKLWKLRYAEPAHNKARITDDYTLEEREEIKRWVKMAKDKTENDHEEGMMEHVWKVRGTPKSGLRLVQIRRQ
jgi:hypothetical protein